MNKKILLLISSLVVSSGSFAGLPYSPIVYPQDEGTHSSYVPSLVLNLSEWWSFKGNINTNEGKHFGYVMTVYNPITTKLGKEINSPVAYIQLSDLDTHTNYSIIKKYSDNSGNFSDLTLKFNLDNEVSVGRTIDVNRQVENFIVGAEVKTKEINLYLNLLLETKSPPLLNNMNGLIKVGRSANAYYYSVPEYKTTGLLKINNQFYTIKDTSTSWLEHQWGDYDSKEVGWEKFNISLNNGLQANILLINDLTGKTIGQAVATVKLPSGVIRYLSNTDIKVTRNNYWRNPKTLISYPQSFNFDFVGLNLLISTKSAFPNQVNNYWSGYSDVDASYQDQKIGGYAYSELKYKK